MNISAIIGILLSSVETFASSLFVFFGDDLKPLFLHNLKGFLSGQQWLYLLFWASFMAYSLGALGIAFLSDRWGRKAPLYLSISGVGIVSFLIAFLPTQNEICSILFILLICLQSLFIGGEFSSCVFTVEHEKDAKPWRASGAVCTFNALGLFAASALHFVSIFFHLDLWRQAFLMLALLCVLGGLLRRKLFESFDYSQAALKDQKNIQSSWGRIIKDHKFAILKVAILHGFFGTLYYTTFVFLPGTLLETQAFSKQIIFGMQSSWLILYAIFLWVAGNLAQKGNGDLYLKKITCLVFLGTVPLIFLYLQGGYHVFFAQVILTILSALFIGPIHAKCALLLPASVRMRGIALGIVMSSCLITGPGPILLETLVFKMHFSLAPALWLMLHAGLAYFVLSPQEKRKVFV